MNIKLYYTPKTRALRPRWLLEELQLDYTLHSIDLFGGEGQTPAYRRIHPHGHVPAIEIDGQVMIESGAICHWLTDQHADKGLAPPPGSVDRRQYEQWMFYAPGTLEPPAFMMILHSSILPAAERVAGIVPWASKRYTGSLEILDRELQDKDYLLGATFSTADIMIGSTLMWFPDMLKKFAQLQAYTERLQNREACQKANLSQE